jgi:hypothetical protein
MNRRIFGILGVLVMGGMSFGDVLAPGVLPWPAVPGFIKPGTRFVYKMGLAVVPGSEYKTLTDANGPLVNPTTGGHYVVKETGGQSIGGIGYDVVDIAGVTSVDAVAMKMTQFTVGGGDNPVLSMAFQNPGSGVGALKNCLIKGADPASLAAYPEQTNGVVRTGFRSDFVVGNKTYHAITIIMQNDQLFSAHVYDLETGLCLHSGMTVQGSSAHVGGDPGARNGGTTIMLQDLVDVRDVQTPWSGSALPQALAGVQSMTYDGISAARVRFQTPLQFNLAFHDGTSFYLPFTLNIQHTGNFMPGLQPQPVPPTQDVTSQSLLAPLAVDPGILGKLAKDQVIDTDPDIGYTTSVSYIGPDNSGKNVVVISQMASANAQANPRIDSVYDPATGIMVEQDKSDPIFQTTQTMRLSQKN